jgi:hypothetical protein
MDTGDINIQPEGSQIARKRFYQTAASVRTGLTEGALFKFDAPLIKLADGTLYYEHVNYGTNPVRRIPTEDELEVFSVRVNKYAALYSQKATEGDRDAYLRGLGAEEKLVNFAKSIVLYKGQAIFWLMKIKVEESFTKLISIAL